MYIHVRPANQRRRRPNVVHSKCGFDNLRIGDNVCSRKCERVQHKINTAGKRCARYETKGSGYRTDRMGRNGANERNRWILIDSGSWPPNCLINNEDTNEWLDEADRNLCIRYGCCPIVFGDWIGWFCCVRGKYRNVKYFAGIRRIRCISFRAGIKLYFLSFSI